MLRVKTAPPPDRDLVLYVLGETATLRVRMATTLMVEQAEWTARLAVAAAEKAAAEDGSEFGRAERLGVQFATYIGELAKAAILGWDLADDSGAAVPCDPPTIGTVMALNPELAKEFDRRYAAAIADRRLEGNGSAPAPNGTTAAGAIIAATADPAPAGTNPPASAPGALT